MSIVAQPGPPQGPPAGPPPGQVEPRHEEVQQLIEALYISQLQDELKLSDKQYAALIPLVKNYLRARQMGARNKHQAEQELNRMLDAGAPDDQIQAKLNEVDQIKKQNEKDLEAAHAAIDANLDVKQRARFRQYQQHTDQRINRMIQQIREGRRMQRMQQEGSPRPRGMGQNVSPPPSHQPVGATRKR